MFCEKCGKELENGQCPNCGNNVQMVYQQPTPESKPKDRCLTSFILGLIGATFGLFGGICTTMCSLGSASNSAFIFIFGGSLIGLGGACLCLNKSKIGSILETVAALLLIYRAFFGGGSDFMTVIAILFLLSGGLIGLVCSFLIKRK